MLSFWPFAWFPFHTVSKVSFTPSHTNFFTATTFLTPPSPAGPCPCLLCPKGLLSSSVKTFSSPSPIWGETDPNWKSNPGFPCGNVDINCGLAGSGAFSVFSTGTGREDSGVIEHWYPGVGLVFSCCLVLSICASLKPSESPACFLCVQKLIPLKGKLLMLSRALSSTETFEAGFSCSSFRVPQSRGLLPFKSLGRFQADVSGRSTH